MLAIYTASAVAATVPTVQIASGVNMPQINLGTCCGSEPKVGMQPWLDAGATGIDTAYDYGDQGDIGKVLAASGAPKRSDLFITTKIPAGFGRKFTDCSTGTTGSTTALNYVKTDIQQLGVDYVDLVLLHAPCRSGAAANAALWKGLEDALAQNLTRSIGISNYKPSDIDALMKTAKVKPAVNQCYMSVKNHDDTTIAYCQKEGIAYEAYDAMKGCDFSSQALKDIGTAHNKSVSQVCLRYIIDRGCIIAVGTGSDPSTVGPYAKENTDIFDFKLSDDEMKTINNL